MAAKKEVLCIKSELVYVKEQSQEKIKMLLLISLLASDLANKGLPRQEPSSKPGVVDGEVTATAAATVGTQGYSHLGSQQLQLGMAGSVSLRIQSRLNR